MSFQFECPNGHLLEGTPDQAGQQCHCPSCGMLFLIPEPAEAPAEEAWAGGVPAAAPIVSEAPSSKPLHIPCPKGHELETPLDMLDTEVLCPECNTRFTLRRKNSKEFKKAQAEAMREKEAKLSDVWLKVAIFIAIVIVGGLGALIAMSM